MIKFLTINKPDVFYVLKIITMKWVILLLIFFMMLILQTTFAGILVMIYVSYLAATQIEKSGFSLNNSSNGSSSSRYLEA